MRVQNLMTGIFLLLCASAALFVLASGDQRRHVAAFEMLTSIAQGQGLSSWTLTSGGQTLASSDQDALVPQPGPIDAGFARAMIAHHNQALQLAALLEHHADPAVAGLARSIQLKQTHETGVLTGWLLAWSQPAMVADPMEWVNQTTRPLSKDDVLFISNCRAQPGRMPGQASDTELAALKAARSSDQSRQFYALMIRHHEAAIDMARFAFAHARIPFVRQFALTTIKEQGREIAWMQQRLASNPFNSVSR